MEFKELLEILKGYCLFLLLSTIVFAVVALVGSLQIPPLHTAQVTLYIKREAQPANDEFYNYDGYYAQQAAERYTDTVAGLLRTKDMLRASLREINAPADQETLRTVEKKVEIKKTAPQLVQISAAKRFNYTESWQPQELVGALAENIVQREEELNQDGDEAFSVELLNEEPIVESREMIVWLNTLVGGTLGLAFAFFVVSFRLYLKC